MHIGNCKNSSCNGKKLVPNPQTVRIDGDNVVANFCPTCGRFYRCDNDELLVDREGNTAFRQGLVCLFVAPDGHTVAILPLT